MRKNNFKPGVYKHFKGDLYFTMMLAKDSETLADFVVYIPLYYKPEPNTRAWIRSVEDFMGYKVMEDGKKIKRFKFISER